jgi:predicted nucleotidyltransferase
MERVKPAENAKEALTDHQRAVMNAVLGEEGSRREHVVIHLGGAHAFGFPSHDSDLDLKGVHVAPTADLLGFEVPPVAADRAEVIDGVEIDYTSNELAQVLSGILVGNGSFLERVLGRMTVIASPLLEELRPLARRSLCRRVHRHYRGFAHNQLGLLEKEPKVKKLLYVLRTTTTGIHLLRTGEIEPDLTRLMDVYGLADAAALVERKRTGERVAMEPGLVEAWRPRIDALFERLDAEREKSPLPEEAPNVREVRDWLLAVRRARFQ